MEILARFLGSITEVYGDVVYARVAQVWPEVDVEEEVWEVPIKNIREFDLDMLFTGALFDCVVTEEVARIRFDRCTFTKGELKRAVVAAKKWVETMEWERGVFTWN